MTARMHRNKGLIWSALLISITIGIVAPLELYFVNFDNFWFGLSEIFIIPLLAFTSIFILVVCIGIILPEKIVYIYSSLVTAFGLCLYIQGNFLNLNVGLFDGNWIEWEDYYNQFAVNIVVWVVGTFLFTVLGAIILKKRKETLFTFFCILLCGMQLSGLVSLIVPKVIDNGNIWEKRQCIVSDKNLFSVGIEKNIIVIVLDSFDEKFFEDFKNSKNELLEDFDGFTYYANHSGTFFNTYYSMASMINGTLFLNEQPISDWVEHQSDEYNYYDELLDAGYTISIYTNEFEHIPSYLYDKIDNFVDGKLEFRNQRTKFSLIYKMVVCKYFPDVFKQKFWLNGDEFSKAAMSTSEYRNYYVGNAEFRDGLKANDGIDLIEGESDFKLIHLYGAHEAYYLDEEGNDTDPHYDGQKMTKGLMHIVTAYLDGLKEKNVYDKCSIIITGDHGCGGWPGIITNPAMLIKPAGASGELKISSAPTSHADIAATIIDLAGMDDYSQFGESILRIGQSEERERYYYGYSFAPEDGWQPKFINGNHGITVYSVPNESNDPWGYELTDIEITPSGQKISHKEFCQSCADGTELSEYDIWPVRRHVWKDNYPR